MQLIERTKKEQKSYDKQKRKEVFMKNLTLLKARILKTKLDPSDTRTIQVHSDTEGKMRNFYISNPYLQTNANFTCVSSILEDYENNRFIYKGMLLGADNAIGVVEFNVPISEVVADPNGNVKFQEMISEENALGVCQRYWDKIGENAEKIKGHSTYFGKPDFVLGTLLKRENGTFEYTDTIDDTVEKMLAQDRESARQKEML